MNSTRPALRSVSPFFVVADLDKAVSYYETTLGFEAIVKLPEDDAFFAMVSRDGVTFCLKEVGAEPNPNHLRHRDARWDAFVNVDEPEGLYAEYRASKAIIHSPLADTDDGLRAFEIRDLDDYVICFGKPID